MNAAAMAAALGGRTRNGPGWLARCCCHEDRHPSLSLRDGDNGRVLLYCHAGCDTRNVIEELKALGLLETRERTFAPLKPKPKPAAATDNRSKARWLWHQSQPIQQTVAEIYLRCERRICCPLLATLRYLSGKGQHPPSMIAAFGFAAEPEPGVLSISENDVIAVHLTKLTPDGRKHPDKPDKITLGSAPGVPIVLAPMTDMLGLAICEGIEDALSIHQATGLGVWAAGSAGRMPALAEAVPDWTDAVTVFADGDATGENNAVLLAEALDARNIAVEIVPMAQVTR
jgi:Toprim domain